MSTHTTSNIIDDGKWEQCASHYRTHKRLPLYLLHYSYKPKSFPLTEKLEQKDDDVATYVDLGAWTVCLVGHRMDVDFCSAKKPTFSSYDIAVASIYYRFSYKGLADLQTHL
jgi:hypothetical protein